MILLFTILATLLSAILYRLGGMSVKDAKRYPPWKWFPEWAVNTKARDIGCALIGTGWMIAFLPAVTWWIHLIGFGLLFGALTTYWDWLFGDEDNFYMHGAMCAFAYIPYAIATGAWVNWGIRIAVMAVFMGTWCLIFSDDYVEECGRGAIIAASLPLLLI